MTVEGRGFAVTIAAEEDPMVLLILKVWPVAILPPDVWLDGIVRANNSQNIPERGWPEVRADGSPVKPAK